MHRDMSYDLDATFSQRGAGELQRTEVVRTKVHRTPGLRVTSQPEQHLLISQAKDIGPAHLYKEIGQQGLYKPTSNGPQYKSLAHSMGRPAPDMAGLGAGFLDDEVTLFGHQVSVKYIAVGAGLGALAWWLLRRKRRHAH
jgi:LPXTG-motif cell wall-anchored protein